MAKKVSPPEIVGSFKSHEAIVCFMDVRGFSSFARTQMSDVQVAKFIQALFVLFGRYILDNMPKPVHIKGVGDGLLTIWTADGVMSSRTYFIENIPVVLSQAVALHSAVAEGRLPAETKIPVTTAGPRYLGFGVFVGPIASAKFVMPDGSTNTEYFGTAINIAARLQDFSRPTGVTIACVPDFNAALRSAVESVGRDVFELIELDSSSLKGVLGENVLQAYSSRPSAIPKDVFPDLRERQAIAVDDLKEIEERLHAPQEGKKLEAITHISARRLNRFLDDLKAIALNPNESLDIRNPALASFLIVAGPSGLDVVSKFIEEKNPHWDLIETCLAGIKRYRVRRFESIVLDILQHKDCPESTLFDGLECLGEIGSSQSVDFLVKALKHQNWGVQQRAVETLGKLMHPSKLEIIGGVLMDVGAHTRVKSTAAKILGEATSEISLQLLLEATKTADDSALEEVVTALGSLKDARAAGALTEILLDGTRPENLRRYAAQALGSIQSKHGTEVLMALIVDKTEGHLIRGSAIISLGKLMVREAIPSLCMMAEDDDEYVPLRIAAMSALTKFIAIEVIPISRRLMKATDPSLVEAGIIALGQHRDHASFADIQAILVSSDIADGIKMACVIAMLKINVTRATSCVIAAFDGLSAIVQEGIIREFGEQKCWPAVRFLIDLVNAPADATGLDIQVRAVQSLKHLKEHRVVEALCKVVVDDTRPVVLRSITARSLGAFRGFITEARLKELVRPDWPNEVVQGVMSALIDIQAPE